MATKWLQSGKDSDQFWYEEDYDCNTGFKSSVIVRNDEGMPRTMDKITTTGGAIEFVFPQVGNRDKIHVKVKTLGDDSKAKADKVTINLTALNMAYMMTEMNKLLSSKTKEEQDALIADSDALATALIPSLNPSLLVVNVRTYTFNTGSDGIGEKEIFVEDEWPPGPLFLTCHYGYSASAERSDEAKFLDFLVEDILPLVVDLALAIGMLVVGCGTAPVTAGVGCAVAFAASIALLSAEIAYMYHRINQDAYGFIDTNNYSCRFPVPGGFNHPYTIDVVQTMGDKLAPIVRASPALMNAGDVASSNPSVQSYTSMGLAQSSARPNNTIILVMLILGGIYFIMEGDDE